MDGAGHWQAARTVAQTETARSISPNLRKSERLAVSAVNVESDSTGCIRLLLSRGCYTAEMIAEERPAENRIRTIASIWAIAAGLFYCYDILRDTGATLTTNGRPLGDDFVNYWSGAFLAWHDRAADVYNWPAYHAFQQSIVGDTVGAFHYSYPPVLLILTAPLAALPYLPGLAAWLAVGWFAFYCALRVALPARDALLLAFATPAVF